MNNDERNIYILLNLAGRENEALEYREMCERRAGGIADTILEQLGGSRFIAMTGSKNFIADGNTLRMALAKNKSKANRLFITLNEASDTYKMRFFYYFPGRVNKKTLAFSPEKTEEIAEFEGVYAEDLRRIFTSITGMDTRLCER